jgi:oxygen-independent coproporphyrinogen-3 oxidase
VSHLHLGGGTPTWLTPEQLGRLFDILSARFDLVGECLKSVEVDPSVTTEDHLVTLSRHGFRRVSLGVQSMEPDVLEKVGRPQSAENVLRVIASARRLGFESVGVDLLYGLPGQTCETVRRTVNRLVIEQVDRAAVFGYAHVPWMHDHQRSLEAYPMPEPADRARQQLTAREAFREAGYSSIGFDHFALPNDPLAVAAREGSLRRDFMGYTPDAATDLIGLGVSAISCVQGVFFQQEASLGVWNQAADKGELPIARGWILTPEDEMRKYVIDELCTQLCIDAGSFLSRFGVSFWQTFVHELGSLKPLVADGWVRVDAQGVHIQESGRPLVRVVAARFDAYMRPASGGAARYSASV